MGGGDLVFHRAGTGKEQLVAIVRSPFSEEEPTTKDTKVHEGTWAADEVTGEGKDQEPDMDFCRKGR